jgi:hypothetical protein
LCGNLDFIKGNAEILYIVANLHPALAQFRPVDNSHLDASDAQAFSEALAVMIRDWLLPKSSSDDGHEGQGTDSGQPVPLWLAGIPNGEIWNDNE